MAVRADEIDVMRGAVDIDRDRGLVLRHQRGDGGAFDELYRRYYTRLVAFCARRVNDQHAAEELAQEAFARALRAMPRFAGERRFYPWLTVIAHRLCIDHHRQASRVEPVPEPDPGCVDADHEALYAAVDHHHLGLALARLAPRHREILELREDRGWSYQEIATSLDVPMTTVEALLHRARRALRREYLAVAGDDRGGRLGLALLGGGMLARLKRWLAALTPEKVVPAMGTAAAGALAVGMLAGPLIDGGDDTTTVAVDPAATVAGTTGGPAAVGDPVTVDAADPGSAGSGTAGSPTSAPGRPPVLATDVVSVATDREAADAAADENATQPIHIQVPGIVDVGLDPAEAAERLLTPGGSP